MHDGSKLIFVDKGTEERMRIFLSEKEKSAWGTYKAFPRMELLKVVVNSSVKFTPSMPMEAPTPKLTFIQLCLAFIQTRDLLGLINFADYNNVVQTRCCTD